MTDARDLVTDYLTTALSLEDRASAVRKTAAVLSAYIDKFDCIAFRGMSGALVAPSVADQLGKELILVRKGESHHGEAEIEGVKSRTRYVIVDDFISQGTTVREIYLAIERNMFAANCVPLLIALYARQNVPGDTHNLGDGIYCSLIGTEDRIVPVEAPPMFSYAVKVYDACAKVGNRVLGVVSSDGFR